MLSARPPVVHCGPNDSRRESPRTAVNRCLTRETGVDGSLETLAPERRRSAMGRTQSDASSSTARLAVGELLGWRYRIEREIGEGGMGVVYVATDQQVPGERFAVPRS